MHNNSVIIDQTLLFEASRLFEHVPVGDEFINYIRQLKHNETTFQFRTATIKRFLPSNQERIFNLSILLNAIVLYDNVYLLNSESPPDEDRLSLRNKLIINNIVKELDVSEYSKAITSEFRSFISHTKLEQASHINKEILIAINNYLNNKKTVTNKRLMHERSNILLDAIKGGYEVHHMHPWLVDRNIDIINNPISALYDYILRVVEYAGSGSILEGISHLRTFIYWRLSDHMSVPFFPSCLRIPIYNSLCSFTSKSIQEDVYKIISSSFKVKINEIYKYDSKVPLVLPPLLTIYLEKLIEKNDPTECIIELRNEFKSIRDEFNKLISGMQNSETLGEKYKYKLKFNEIIRELYKQYNLDDDNYIDEIIGFIPSLINPLTNLTDPTKYSEDLAKKPIKWIKNWWLKRPYRIVFNLRKKLDDIKEYESLVSKALNITLDKKEINEFKLFYDIWEDLYNNRLNMNDKKILSTIKKYF